MSSHLIRSTISQHEHTAMNQRWPETHAWRRSGLMSCVLMHYIQIMSHGSLLSSEV